jgi:hypothetical protein
MQIPLPPPSKLRCKNLTVLLSSISQTFSLADPFRLRKITTDPYILAHVIQCPDDWHPKLDTYISELILGSHEYIPVAYVTMHCII